MIFEVRESDPLALDETRDLTKDDYVITARLFCRIPFGFTKFAISEKQRIDNDKSIIKQLAQ
jgi:hypothetical protein